MTDMQENVNCARNVLFVLESVFLQEIKILQKK